MWNKVIDEEGLTRTWTQWTMYQKRASGSLDVDEPYVMEKGKWMFNPQNQAYYEESYITNYQYLLNQEMMWLGYQKWKMIIWCEVFKSQPRRINAKARSNVTTIMKSKRNKVARINLVQAQVEKVVFLFNLEYRLPLYQEGYHMDYQQSLNTHIT
jgi:hypothetical protein